MVKQRERWSKLLGERPKDKSVRRTRQRDIGEGWKRGEIETEEERMGEIYGWN